MDRILGDTDGERRFISDQERRPTTEIAVLGRGSLLRLSCFFVLGVLIALLPWTFRKRFYFHDDMQHQFVLAFYHIGRLLRQGEFPLLSPTTWFGGNLIGEYQYALFNPVSLGIYALLPSIDDYHTGSLLLACVHYGVLTAGSYALARSFDIDRLWASVVALVVASNNFFAYWAASNWFPILASCAWFVWAWAFLLRANRSRGEWLLAVLFCYLTITSGFPQTTLMLGIVCLLVAWQDWRAGGLVKAGASTAALTAAILFSFIPTLAVLTLGGDISNRPQGVFNNNFLVPNLRDVLTLSSPFHLGFIKSFGGYGVQTTPNFFVAWFVLPLLPLLDWSKVDWRRPANMALLAITGLTLLATQGPEYLQLIRFPFRWLPYLHIFLIVLFCALASQAGFIRTLPRRVAALGIALLLCISSLQTTPEHWERHLVGALACLIGLGLFVVFIGRREALKVGVLVLFTVGLLVSTRALFRVNADVGDWGVPRLVNEAAELVSPTVPSTYGIYLGTAGDLADVDRLLEFKTGFMPVEAGIPMVNGYTAIRHRPMSDLICMHEFSETCPDAAHRLFEQDPQTGKPLVDLFRINRITAMKGPHLDALRPYVGAGGWRLERDGRLTQRFVRDLAPDLLPGTLAWTSPGVRAEAQAPAQIRRERLVVNNTTSDPARLVFARLWWPGYRASLDGASVPVSAHRGVFVTVELPPGSSGVLTLRFLPPLLGLGLAALGIGALLVLGVLVYFNTLLRAGGRQAVRPTAVASTGLETAGSARHRSTSFVGQE